MNAAMLNVLIASSVRVSVVAALVALLLATLRIRSTGIGHACWTTVLCAMLVMPILPYMVPSIALAVALPSAAAGQPARERPLEALRGFDARRGTPAVASDRHSIGTSASSIEITSSRELTSFGSSFPGSPLARLWVSARTAALIVYAIGALMLLVRSLIGSRIARRVARTSEPVVLPPREALAVEAGGVRVRASRSIATPVTVGVVSPTIVLPETWTRWSGDTLQAVLAHELSHVRRRDPLVAILAQVNHCMYWFHPLAWWLERELAAMAEHASDEAAVRALGVRGRYAEILLDMSRAVHQRGQRLSWQGIGMDGSGLLGQRIERVLGDDPSSRSGVSFVRKSVLAVSTAAAILLVAACRPQFVSPVVTSDEATEQRDHTLRLDLERLLRSGWADLRRSNWDMTPGQLEALEAAVDTDPANLVALKDLLVGYWIHFAPDQTITTSRRPNRRPVAADDRFLIARRARILDLIERHPDAELAGSIEAQLFSSDFDPAFPPQDVVGYQEAKKLWLGHVNRNDATSPVLGNASYFFETSDKALAEDLLLRARALHPEGPWSARIGRLYTVALTGARALAGNLGVRATELAEPNSAFGLAVQKKLTESSDDAVLTAAGWFLSGSAGLWRRPSGLDPAALAEACFKRALQVNPHAVLAHTKLLQLTSNRTYRAAQPLWNSSLTSRYDTASTLPDVKRFELLPPLIYDAIRGGQVGEQWSDPNLQGYIDLSREQAAKFADDALKLAPKFRGHPRYGLAIYTANMTLGSLALVDGDQKKAVEYLRKASAAPASEELVYQDGLAKGWRWHLLRDLLERGERDALAQFFERMAATNIADRIELREAAAAIRRGETPRL